MKIDIKEVLKPTLILFVICFVVAAALAGTNLLTEDKIEAQQAAKAEESRKIVLSAADAFEARDGYYEGTSGGATIGYVFETSAKGYGGDVKVMTGVTADGQISGVVILSHGETPGLGANAEREEFRSQYQQPVPEAVIQVVKYQTPREGEIEAMTGATITSRAVTSAVNEAVRLYHGIQGGGANDGT